MPKKRLILLFACLFGVFIFYCLADTPKPLFLPKLHSTGSRADQPPKTSLRAGLPCYCFPLKRADSFYISCFRDGMAVPGGQGFNLPRARAAEFEVPDFGAPSAVSCRTDMLPALKNIFRNEGVPSDMVWLAEVESAFDPNAESKAGAAGLFQLMPATAERFGLKTFPHDERVTPGKNARAAAAYLRHLREEFGCWSLALAAYNAGEGRVVRIMKQCDAKTFSEIAPYLPAETRRYVPRAMTIIALREDQLRGVPAACVLP